MKNLLISTPHEKLVDVLISLHASNNSLKKQLDIIFAGLDDDPKKIVSMIKKEIASLKRSSKFIDYYESDSLANRLNELRLRIINDLRDKSSKHCHRKRPSSCSFHPKATPVNRECKPL